MLLNIKKKFLISTIRNVDQTVLRISILILEYKGFVRHWRGVINKGGLYLLFRHEKLPSRSRVDLIYWSPMYFTLRTGVFWKTSLEYKISHISYLPTEKEIQDIYVFRRMKRELKTLNLATFIKQKWQNWNQHTRSDSACLLSITPGL